MKRILAMFAIVMCLAVSMVPMAFAETATYAACDVRVAGFEHGFSTLRPSASYSSGFYGGIVVFDGINCTSATVSDLVWINDGSATGYFTVVYTITVDPVSVTDLVGKPIVAIPLNWGSGNVRYEWQVSPDMNMRMEDATTDMHMHSLSAAGGPYHVDGTHQTMMTFTVSGYEEATEITEIKIGLKVWDTDATIITSAALDSTNFWDMLRTPFIYAGAGGGVILGFFATIMNTTLFFPIIAIACATLLMSVIISIVR